MMTTEALQTALRQSENEVIAWRRWFHENPELSMKEQRTSEKIRAEIERLGLPYERVGEYGLLARLDCGGPGRTVLMRADMDALPVDESENNLAGPKRCVSQTPGVSHACGHDAHLAMQLGAMRVLCSLREQLCGTVLFAFEQGEEIGGGVLAMLQALDKHHIDCCWGVHVYAGLAAGKISVEPGSRMAAISAFTITVVGRGGHASRPDLAVSPLMCAANILVNLNNIWTCELDPTKTVTLGIAAFRSGEKGNVIADEASFSGSLRYYDTAEGEKAFAAVKRVSECVAAAHRCQIRYDRILQSSAVCNTPDCAALAAESIGALLGRQVLGSCPPWFATDSMACYLERWPGVYAFLGIADPASGCGAGHHTREFDLDDRVLALGTAAGVAYVTKQLDQKKEV